MSQRKLSVFTMGRYLKSPKNSSDSVTDRVFGDKIVVTKGDVVKTVELTDVKTRLARLKAGHTTQIKDLSGQLFEDFKVLQTHVNMLYETKSYDVLFNLVKDQFQDLKDVAKDTVGGYCAGCLLKSEKGCSAICNDALPRPKSEEGWKFCSYPVYFATFENGKYKFTAMNKKQSKEAMVYIESPQPYPFSPQEKALLKSFGIERVQLIHAPMQGREFKELSTQFIPVDSLPQRGGSPNSPNVNAAPAEKFNLAHANRLAAQLNKSAESALAAASPVAEEKVWSHHTHHDGGTVHPHPTPLPNPSVLDMYAVMKYLLMLLALLIVVYVLYTALKPVMSGRR